MIHRGREQDCINRRSEMVEYCRTPRTAKQMAEYFNISKTSICVALKKINSEMLWIKADHKAIKVNNGWLSLYTTIRKEKYIHIPADKLAKPRGFEKPEDKALQQLFGYTNFQPSRGRHITEKDIDVMARQHGGSWNPSTLNSGKCYVSGSTLSMAV